MRHLTEETLSHDKGFFCKDTTMGRDEGFLLVYQEEVLHKVEVFVNAVLRAYSQ
jgi:hypothetical protein